VERYFADLLSATIEQPHPIVEPAQRGERRVIVQGGGQTDYLEIAYHTPEARHPDYCALTVLNAVLTGGASFLIGRGSLTNHTCRLYKALVDRELATDIDGDIVPTVDPGLYRFTATVRPGHSAAALEQALLSEIDRIQTALLTPEELAKARRQARALFAYASESITHQGFWMGFTNIFADYSWYLNYLDRIEAVTAEDIRRVAQAYLGASNRTVGWYLGSATAP
jgi:zinc protease